MGSSVSPKDEILFSARVRSHFNWPEPLPPCLQKRTDLLAHNSAEARSRYLRLKLVTSWNYSYISVTSDCIVALLSVLCRELQTWDDHWWPDVGPEVSKKMQALFRKFLVRNRLKVTAHRQKKKSVSLLGFSRDSSFPITNRLRRGRPGNRYSISGRNKEFCLSKAPGQTRRPHPTPTIPLLSGYLVHFSRKVKRLGRKADHPSSRLPRLRVRRAIPPVPSPSLWRSP